MLRDKYYYRISHILLSRKIPSKKKYKLGFPYYCSVQYVFPQDLRKVSHLNKICGMEKICIFKI